MPGYSFCFYYGKDNKDKKSLNIDEENALVEEPLKEFAKDFQKKPEDYAFYYKGSEVKYEKSLKLKDSIFAPNEGKITNIFVMLLTGPISSEEKDEPEEGQDKNEIKDESQKKNEAENKEQSDEPPIIRRRINKMYYNDIICPKCKTTAIIDKNGDELNLKILNCENFHYLNNIKYDLFDDFVFDYPDENLKELGCSLCGTPKKELTPPKDQLYMCSCGAKVCSGCFRIHNDEGHYKINLDDKNYYCITHNQKFSSYCFDCNANFCDKCETEHKGHEIEKFSKIKPKREEVKDLENKVDDQKEKLLDFIETTRQLFDDIINTVESYLNSYIMIEKGLIRRYNRQELNYQLIRNLKNKKLFDNNIFQKLEELDKKPDLNKKFNSLFNDIYEPINTAKQKKDEKKKPEKINQIPNNTMIITYNIAVPKLERRVKLFDQVFVENNKDKLSLEIEGVRKGKTKKEKKELVVYYNNDLDYQNFKVTLSQIGNKPFITDMSYMFNNCKYLQSVDFKNWRTDNIISMEAMFQLCKLKKIPELPSFGKNLENIRAMFCKCTEINEISNIIKWFNNKEYNLSNISMLFNGCKALTSITLPKNWYYSSSSTSKLTDMSYMFNRCEKLTNIKHLNYIQTSNVKNMCGLFNGCKELIESIELKAPNVEDLSIMFQGCKKLTKMKNSFGENKSLKDISGMFSGCSSLKKDINTGIANTDKVTNVTGLFKNCENLEGLADIGKWNMAKVEKYKGMFYGCKKLKEPKGINKWKFNKDTKYEQIVENSSLDGLKAAWQGNEAKNTIDN